MLTTKSSPLQLSLSAQNLKKPVEVEVQTTMSAPVNAIVGNVSDTRNIVLSSLLIAFVSMGGILFGYDTGVISGIIANPDFIDVFGAQNPDGTWFLPTSRKSLMVSILSLGTFVGAALAGPMADWRGRRIAITISCAIFCVGVGLQLDPHYGPFLAGRVLAGLGVGATSVLGPMYQSETAPKRLRGLLVGGYEGCVTIGLLLAAIVDQACLKYHDFRGWRIPIAVQFVYGVSLGLGILLLPETPRYLVSVGKMTQARVAIQRLSGFNETDLRIDHELNSIEASVEMEGTSSYASLFKRGQDNKLFRRTLTSCGLCALQQLCGINFIFYYGTSFFQNSGIKNPFVINVIVNVVNVVTTIPGLWAIDNLGRRFILFWGAIGMTISQLIVAIVGVAISTHYTVGQKVLITFVCTYIASFAAAWGPGMWTVGSEIFPIRNRAKGMSVATSFFWFWNFLIGFVTPYMVDDGPHNANLQVKVFFIWGAFSALCAVYVYFFIPETRRLSLEQIDLMWRTSDVRHSNQRRKEILAASASSATEGMVEEVYLENGEKRVDSDNASKA